MRVVGRGTKNMKNEVESKSEAKGDPISYTYKWEEKKQYRFRVNEWNDFFA